MAVVLGGSLSAGAITPTFYPESSVEYCLVSPDGETQQFIRDPSNSAHLIGEKDWVGERKGRRVSLASVSLKDCSRGTVLCFENGHLTSWTKDGVPMPVTAGASVSAEADELFPSVQTISRYVNEAVAASDLWRKAHRFRFLSENPNVTAAALIGLCLLAFGFVWGRYRPAGRALAGVVFVGLAYLIFRTGSRGGMLALACGMAVFACAAFVRKFRWRTGLPLVLLVIVVLAGSLFGIVRLTNRGRDMFGQDELRADIHQCIPSMVADAPHGVGIGRSGMTYDIWYRNPEITRTVRTLIGSHQTLYVELGNFGRIVYVTAWFLLLALLWSLAIRRCRSAPCAVWVALVVAGAFNPVFESPFVWVAPVIALVWALWDAHCFVWNRATLWTALIGLVVGLSISGCVLATLIQFGRERGARLPIRVSPLSVCVNGTAPDVWVVTDEFVLGGWDRLGREVDDYFQSHDMTGCIGFVDRIDDLPVSAERVVLAGRSVAEYLKRWSLSDQRTKLCRVARMMLLSPSIQVDQLPEDLVRSTNIRAIVGELAMGFFNYNPTQMPRWIRVSPGSRLYIPGWVSLMLEF